MKKEYFTREYISERIAYFEDCKNWLRNVRYTFEESLIFLEYLRTYCCPISEEYDKDIIDNDDYLYYWDKVCSVRHNMIKYHIGWLLNLWKDGQGHALFQKIGVECFVLTIYNDFFRGDYKDECLTYYNLTNELEEIKKSQKGNK